MGFWHRSSGILKDFAARFTATRDNEPIDSVSELTRFVVSRSAFVAQHKLYGYVKTRMGTRYPAMFENDRFIQSLNIAKMHVFAACLSDLAVHAVAKATPGMEDGVRDRLARSVYNDGIAEYASQASGEGDVAMWNTSFAERLTKVNWDNVAAGADAFTTSPKALVRWAPIAEELKKYDVEIIRNSVRFAWHEVIRTLRKRLDVEAIQAELNGVPN
ncbi:MAG: hypothetical protein JJ864_10995 [Rhizobiaceae bacterium]|nr:hypothetical protein [Rhizobiaceae bacterium]